MITFRLAAIALVSVAGLWATPIYGTAGYSVNVKNVTKVGSVLETAPTGSLAYNNASLGYGLVLSWDVGDPTLSWSFTTTTSGLHTLQFYMGFPMGRFDDIFTSIGYTITGNRRGKGATVSDVVVKPYSPLPVGAAKNYIPEGFATLKGLKAVKGTLTRSNDNTNSGGIGDFVAMPSRDVKNMGVEITFNTTLAAGDKFALNGTMTLDPVVPEPATISLMGAALIALLVFARRQHA
ncbi:MAG: PEP-CTERM sorting domain-containing protein [Acidobacteria bacterium]|nr:PEP-CTERM sorting domain-containing protein [Acidobacteriota bacterium]